MTPYRSDLAGRLRWYAHHRPTSCVVAIIVIGLAFVWAFFPEARP
jgi:hypothetical protein